MDWTKIVELAITGLVTLGAAYLGAMFAFRFTSKQQQAALRASRIEECNRAMLALYQQFNSLSNYRDQVLEELRTSAGRHLQLKASTNFSVDHVSVNIAALAFLIETEARDVPADVAILQMKYRSCLDLINQRSAVHLSEYQPALELAMKSIEGDKVSGEMVEQAVGRRLVITLRNATDAIYDQVYETIDEYVKAGAELKTRLKLAYPEGKIIGFAPMARDEQARR